MHGLYTLRWIEHGTIHKRTDLTKAEVKVIRRRLYERGIKDWSLSPKTADLVRRVRPAPFTYVED